MYQVWGDVCASGGRGPLWYPEFLFSHADDGCRSAGNRHSGTSPTRGGGGRTYKKTRSERSHVFADVRSLGPSSKHSNYHNSSMLGVRSSSLDSRRLSTLPFDTTTVQTRNMNIQTKHRSPGAHGRYMLCHGGRSPARGARARRPPGWRDAVRARPSWALRGPRDGDSEGSSATPPAWNACERGAVRGASAPPLVDPSGAPRRAGTPPRFAHEAPPPKHAPARRRGPGRKP